MKNKDVISSLLFIVLGAGICYGGIDLELGRLNNPGAGFMIFWLGLIIIGLSLVMLFWAVGHKSPAADLKMVLSGVRWEKAAYVLIALSLYALVLNYLGFFLSSSLLLVFLFLAIEPQRWSVAVLGAGVSVLAAYLVFQRWLGVQFPKGFLDIG